MEGDDVRQERKRLGLTQARLAAELGVPQTTVSHWETGKYRVAHPRMLALALWALEHGAGEDAADDSAAHYAEMAVGWAEAKS
jgi:transcriptional regulator with XRE-family HTH domain